MRFTLVVGAASICVGASFAAGADNCLCTGFGAATGLGPVILALDGAGLGTFSDLVLALCTGSVSTSPFFAANVAAAACFEASAA